MPQPVRTADAPSNLAVVGRYLLAHDEIGKQFREQLQCVLSK